MLETIREFAEEQLVARGEEDQARTAHARYFAGRETDILALWTASANKRPTIGSPGDSGRWIRTGSRPRSHCSPRPGNPEKRCTARQLASAGRCDTETKGRGVTQQGQTPRVSEPYTTESGSNDEDEPWSNIG
jgi:hypothetical protein